MAGTAGKRESILELERYLNHDISVKFSGGREVQGTLKGFDALVNLVLDNTVEYLQGDGEANKPRSRKLGLTVCKGTSVMLICPVDGTQEIANPFAGEVQEQDITKPVYHQ